MPYVKPAKFILYLPVVACRKNTKILTKIPMSDCSYYLWQDQFCQHHVGHFSRENFFSAILFPVLICQAPLFTISAMLKGHDWDKCPFSIQSRVHNDQFDRKFYHRQMIRMQKVFKEQSKMFFLKRGAQAWLLFFYFQLKILTSFFHFFPGLHKCGLQMNIGSKF